jgi:1-acyl-sn-glycerol-3-phosphate acyltransferase
MNIAQRMVYTPLHFIGRSICCVHDEQLAKVPMRGPLILVANHINFLDVPILYTHLMPRRITGFAKAETWDNPAIGFLFSLGNAIPLRREQIDRSAMDRALQELRAGCILAIAPEGTRSGDGLLRKARSGVAMLALASGAPVLPIAYYGGEQFRRNVVRFRRTEFHIAVGDAFCVRGAGEKASRADRDQIADEIMYKLAGLLPPQYRGYYADLKSATDKFLKPCPAATDGS